MKYLLIEDIKLCSNDFIEYYKIDENFKINIEILIEYTYKILLEIYDIKFCEKYLYYEILEQVLCELYPYLNKKKFIIQDNEDYNKNRVEELLKKEQAPQRSELWYKQRKNSVGASELASVFNKNPFCSYNKYLLKKIEENNISESIENNNINIHCLHGTMYEEIVQKIYCSRNNVKLNEYGSLEHEEYSWLRASPDGISHNGIMLEIKVPLKREIVGLPPIYYWYQMQQQMEICKLDKCDFVECKIEEYNSWNEFLEDKYENNINLDDKLEENNLEKGIILEYLNIDRNSSIKTKSWIYPENINMSLENTYKWIKQEKDNINKDINKEFLRIVCWKVREYSCFRVYRNKSWWNNNFNKIENFWNLVLSYRKNGYNELKKEKKNIEKKNIEKKNIEEYNFISDSE